jgi:phosphohistidine phosphatase
MKRLTLLRHAKSGEDLAARRDFDRQLNGKGRRAARAIGRHMRDSALAFDRVIASPATRVVETVAEVGAGYGAGLQPDWERRAYLASAAELLDLVHEAPDSASSLLLVGHNPGLEQLVLLLVPDQAGDDARDRVEEKYPTASLAEIALEVAHWADVMPGGGRLTRFVRPRDLDPALGPDFAD